MINIVLPIYNRGNLLKQAVSSALDQTIQETQIILVDDGSTDNTNAVAFELQKEYGKDKIIYIKNETNLGAAAARNVGISHAKGEYIAFFDSDDLWHPDKLERQLKLLESSSDEVGMVYCEYQYHQMDGSVGICPDREIPLPLKQGNMFLSLLILPMIGTPCMLIKKSCLLKVGGFNEAFSCLEDYELSLRIAKEFQIEFVPEVLLDAYANTQSVTNNVKGMFEAKIAIIKKYYKELKENQLFDTVTEALFEKADAFGMKKDVCAYLSDQLLEFDK